MEDKGFQNNTLRTYKVCASGKSVLSPIISIHVFRNRHVLVASFIYFNNIICKRNTLLLENHMFVVYYV